MANMMIVDESPVIRRRLREIFENMGHRVVAEAEDGWQALQAYSQQRIDLATMDILLPGIDGIETLRRIRERHKNAAVIMISSLEDRAKVFEAIQAGAKHYILKPFNEEKVIETVHSVLGENHRAAPARKAAQAQVRPAESKREEQKSLGLKPPDMSSLPFELVIKDGRIVLMIQRRINDINVRSLQSCLQGLLYFRKAKYVLELWEPITHGEGLRLVTDFAAAVRARRGTASIITDDPVQYSHLKMKLGNAVYRSANEIKQRPH